MFNMFDSQWPQKNQGLNIKFISYVVYVVFKDMKLLMALLGLYRSRMPSFHMDVSCENV